MEGCIEITGCSITKTAIHLFNDSNETVFTKGILIEGNGLCTIYDVEEQSFNFVCMSRFELDTILATQYLRIKVLKEDELRLCLECGNIMNQGFYFESDGTLCCGDANWTSRE